MRKALDLTGQVFNRLTVIKPAEKISGRLAWLCECSCGNTKIATTKALRKGVCGSCGCLYNDSGKVNASTHEMTGTPEHNTWCSMRKRCNNPNHPAYHNYGGRGIKVCSEWDSFEQFYSDMGARPEGDYSLERIDNEKGYSANNCKWATRLEQANNKRTNKNYGN